MDDVSQQKTAVRAEMRERLAAMDEETRRIQSERIMAGLSRLEAFAHAGLVMLYLPLPDEPDISRLMLRCLQSQATLCVPRIDWDHGRMSPVRLRSFDDRCLPASRKDLNRPGCEEPMPVDMIDAVVVPGLAFDAEGYRVGRGGGFYDRFLGQSRMSAVRIGVAFDFQVVDRVPREGHDKQLDFVVTDRRLIAGRPQPSARL